MVSMPLLIKIALTAIIAYLLFGLLLFILQRSIIFPGQYIKAAEFITENGRRAEKIFLQTSFGQVEAWYFTAPDSTGIPALTVIFAHGNYELIDYCLPEAMGYNQLGINVLLVEFPGYGRSEGKTSRESLNETYIKAYDWLMDQKEIPAQKIIGHGRSLGGGAICDLAARRKLNALVLQSTFADISRFAHRYLLPGFLVRDNFSNLEIIKTYGGPSLIIHGKYDELIPYQNGKELFKNAINGQLLDLDCGHNDCPPDPKKYWATIQSFLQDNVIK